MPHTDAPVKTLSATSFALLAQFARQPCTAYTLAGAMRRNLHYLWPRAESRIYAEVNRLEQLGLVRGVAERTGRRPRTVMHITEAGRATLSAWMANAVTPGLSLESEALLRVYFATLGSRADLQRALATIHSDAGALRGVATVVGEGYLRGDGIAQEQAHVRAMIHALLGRMAVMVQEWATECLATVDGWSDLAPAGKKLAAVAKFRATQAVLAERAVQPTPAAPRALGRRRGA